MRIHVIFFFTPSKRIKHESSMAVSGQIVKKQVFPPRLSGRQLIIGKVILSDFCL
jgi:hypothetical protein